MKAEALKPQMTQMTADVFLNAFICGYLRHLRVAKAGKALRKLLGNMGI